MSIYHNETSKINPDLTAMAPQEPPAYQLKVTEIEAYWLDEIEVVNVGQKKYYIYLFITITAAFADGVALLVGIALSEPRQLFSPATTIAQRSFKIYIVN